MRAAAQQQAQEAAHRLLHASIANAAARAASGPTAQHRSHRSLPAPVRSRPGSGHGERDRNGSVALSPTDAQAALGQMETLWGPVALPGAMRGSAASSPIHGAAAALLLSRQSTPSLSRDSRGTTPRVPSAPLDRTPLLQIGSGTLVHASSVPTLASLPRGGEGTSRQTTSRSYRGGSGGSGVAAAPASASTPALAGATGAARNTAGAASGFPASVAASEDAAHSEAELVFDAADAAELAGLGSTRPSSSGGLAASDAGSPARGAMNRRAGLPMPPSPSVASATSRGVGGAGLQAGRSLPSTPSHRAASSCGGTESATAAARAAVRSQAESDRGAETNGEPGAQFRQGADPLDVWMLREESRQLALRLARATASPEVIATLDLPGLAALRAELIREHASALERIDDRRVKLQARQASSQEGPEPGRCVACWTKKADRVLLPCRHLCVCGDCLQSCQCKCPVCRGPVVDHLEVFGVT
eukprot:TRINITY_DN37986_c0_g1_i1.p1 TRINITY_DN37986_c0_g1~~TRINITY_DN37986_c0_g1_i1.p1  ORF type:complete len:476 (+),score=80.36 TRINITY_DN37986_c0_g1_i1:67-1494(+)